MEEVTYAHWPLLCTDQMRDSVGLCEGTAPLTPSDRGRIIARIHSLLNWCGELIPQQIEVGGRQIDLRDVVYDYITKDNITDEEKQQAIALADMLSEEEDKLEEAIRTGDVDRQRACELSHEARMLLRAVDELRSSPAEAADVKKLHLLKKIDDEKRWNKFVKQLR
ncbi:MAG: hypothetical protein ISF22_03155 [Methanomassiliicoccus sp.]|nr:hypothetical protein [Methanomassiliicoccus sp.]